MDITFILSIPEIATMSFVVILIGIVCLMAWKIFRMACKTKRNRIVREQAFADAATKMRDNSYA